MENLGITEVNARVKMNRLKKTLKELMLCNMANQDFNIDDLKNRGKSKR